MKIQNYNQFKNAIQSGKIKTLEMTYRNTGWGCEIPEHMKAPRKIAAVRSYGLELETTKPSGEFVKSRLEIKASECTFSDNQLTIKGAWGELRYVWGC